MTDPARELSKSSKEHYQQLTCHIPSAKLPDDKVGESRTWTTPSSKVEMEKDDEYRDLGSIDEKQKQMMADSPIAKYNQKEPDVVQVEEKFSDNQEVNSCFTL